MNKIGVITIDGDNNYGNRLQNYALEQAIQSLGFEVETIVFPVKISLRERARQLKNSLQKEHRIKMKKFSQMNELKKEEFLPFRRQHLNSVNYQQKDPLDQFDRFVVGSDQVWNPSWRLVDDYWLRFAPAEKRFSYAASMASNHVHSSNIDKLPRYLKEMNEISVRETESVKLIKEISGRDAKVVVDPTMLLRKEDYEKLICEQEISKVEISKPYILIYALEGLTAELQNQVELLSKSKKWEIVTIMGNNYNNTHKVYNPIEFVEAINNAQFVVSDSFHCGVFSILMETPFVLFNRTDGAQMSSRITTLLTKFDLMDHFYQNGSIINLLEIDFKYVNLKLDKERKDGWEYLGYILNKNI